MWHGITLPNCIPYITEHVINSDLAEKAPPPRKNSCDMDLSISCNLPATLVQLAEKPPPPIKKFCGSCFMQFQWLGRKAPPPRGKNSEPGSFHFMQFPATLVQLAEKAPPFSAFSWETCNSHCTCRIPMVLILQIHTQDSSYPNIFYRLPTLSTFENNHIYRSTGHRIMVQVEGL